MHIWIFLANLGVPLGDFPFTSTFIFFISFPIFFFSCNSHPSFVFSRLLTHAFCHLWWRLVRIWIYLVRAFRAYIHAHSVSLQPKGYLSKTLYDKKGLAGEYQGGLWWMAWWTLEPSLNSYFGFSKSIVIILSFIKPWILCFKSTIVDFMLEHIHVIVTTSMCNKPFCDWCSRPGLGSSNKILFYEPCTNGRKVIL